MSAIQRTAVALLLLALGGAAAAAEPVTLNDDGGWCWFQDERALVVAGKLIVGTIASGSRDPTRKGNVEATSLDLATGAVERFVLHERLQLDDHDSPAFLVRSDGRLLAMYSKHGGENRIYYRVSERPGNATQWREEQVFTPSASSRVTYSNLFRLPAENGGRGRLYNFFRGYNDSFKPSWMISDDDGETWIARGLWIDFPSAANHRPYVKYASNGRDTIHFAFTEGHPRDFDNSVYHAIYREGAYHRSDGARIKAVVDGPILPKEATRIFTGDRDNVAWVSDLHLDPAGRPVLVYSVQKNAAGLGPAHPDAGKDHRYRYAVWDGTHWRDHEIAFAGTRLYPGEDDYTGNACLDPRDPCVVYASSNVDIGSGAPHASGRYEIHRGVASDWGESWTWTPVTVNSHADNLRPVVPGGDFTGEVVLWLRGEYRSFTDYDLEVVGLAGAGSNNGRVEHRR
jgi:hypothetical protein